MIDRFGARRAQTEDNVFFPSLILDFSQRLVTDFRFRHIYRVGFIFLFENKNILNLPQKSSSACRSILCHVEELHLREDGAVWLALTEGETVIARGYGKHDGVGLYTRVVLKVVAHKLPVFKTLQRELRIVSPFVIVENNQCFVIFNRFVLKGH